MNFFRTHSVNINDKEKIYFIFKFIFKYNFILNLNLVILYYFTCNNCSSFGRYKSISLIICAICLVNLIFGFDNPPDEL